MFIGDPHKILAWLHHCNVTVPENVRSITLYFEVGGLATINFECYMQDDLLNTPIDLSQAEVQL
jgi:hypothetical protein